MTAWTTANSKYLQHAPVARRACSLSGQGPSERVSWCRDRATGRTEDIRCEKIRACKRGFSRTEYPRYVRWRDPGTNSRAQKDPAPKGSKPDVPRARAEDICYSPWSKRSYGVLVQTVPTANIRTPVRRRALDVK